MKFLITNEGNLLGIWAGTTIEEATERLERLKTKLKEQNFPFWATVKIEPVQLPIVRNIKNLNKRDLTYLYIGRGSKWGNPYVMRTHEDRDNVIDQYERMILNKQKLLDRLYELNGKILVCYCCPLKCHGDVLVKLFKKRFEL